MKITENNLRRIIRQVILEEYNNSQDEINEGFKENLIGLGIAGLMSLGGFGGVSKGEAKPLPPQKVAVMSDQIVEDNLDGVIDVVVESMIDEILSSVDESRVDDVMNKVINPWMKVVKYAHDNHKHDVTGMPSHIYDSLRRLLSKQVDKYISQNTDTESAKSGRGRGRVKTKLSKSTQSVFSSADKLAYDEAIRTKDYDAAQRIIDKYRQ